MDGHSCFDEGVVQSVKGTVATVRIARSHDCGGCKACIFAGKGDLVVPARNTVCAEVGDRVRINAHKSASGSLLSVSLALGIPLVMLIVCVAICSVTGLETWQNFIISLAVMALGFVITYFSERKWRKSRFAGEIAEVLARDTVTPLE